MRNITLHMIGHGHIDPTWLWNWQEGFEEVRATFKSVLDLMDDHEAFCFTSSSACFFQWVKDSDPELFERLKCRVREGRWEIAGGFWVENGQIAYPVTEITIAGSLPEIYGRLVPGSDLEFRGSFNSPSLMAEGVAVAGL